MRKGSNLQQGGKNVGPSNTKKERKSESIEGMRRDFNLEREKMQLGESGIASFNKTGGEKKKKEGGMHRGKGREKREKKKYIRNTIKKRANVHRREKGKKQKRGEIHSTEREEKDSTLTTKGKSKKKT